MVPSSSVEIPAQNMSWKLLSALAKVSPAGSKTVAWVKVGPLGNALVSVEDHDRTLPSGRFAAEIAMWGHWITGPHWPTSDSFVPTYWSCPSEGITSKAGFPVRYPTSRTSFPPFSKNSTRSSYWPAASVVTF